MKSKKVIILVIFFSILIIMNLLVFAEVENQLSDTNKLEEAALITTGTYTGSLGEKKEGSQIDNEDYYSIKLEEGQLITLQLAIPGNANYYISLLNPNKNSRGSASTEKESKILGYVADSTGTWYIRINRSSGEGEYQLSIEIENQDDAGSGKDAGDSYERAIPLSAGTFSGFLKAGDNTDYYSIQLQKGQLINLNLVIPGNANFGIVLLDPNRNSRGSSITQGDTKFLEYKANSTGTWYIRINRSSGEGEYQLSVHIDVSIKDKDIEEESHYDESVERQEAETKTEESIARRLRETEETLEDGENKPPVALCEFPPVAMIGEVVFDASSSYDPDGEIISYQWEFKIDGKTIEKFSEERVMYKFAEPGKYEIILVVVDDREAEDVKTFTIDIVPPTDLPIAQFTYSLADSEEKNNFFFDGSTSYGPSPIIEYEWDFGDGSIPETGIRVEHKFDSPGTYSVTLTIVDQNGERAKKTQQIDTTALLTASFTFSPREPGLSDTVYFDASSSRGLRNIETYMWDFADGSEAVYGINVEHSFDTPGNYTVRLIVTDESGEISTATEEITVRAIDENAFIQCGIIQANNGQRIPFRASFQGQPIVVTSAVVDGNASVISTPNNITNTHFDILINHTTGNPVSNALVHWIAFVPDSEVRCLGGISETGGQSTVPITFDSPINLRENEQLVVLTNAEKDRAFLSRTSNVDNNGFQVWVSDAQGGAVHAFVYWVAVVPDTGNGFQGSVDTLNNSEAILFDSPFPNQSAVVCNSSALGVIAGAISSTPQQFTVGLSTESALVNWLAFGGAVPPLQTGQIRVSSTPGGATVYLNSSNVGTTPFDDTLEITDLSPGEYTIKLELQDYRVFETNVTVNPAATVMVNPTLHTNPGTILVSSDPPDATIKIDHSPNYPFYWDNQQGWVNPLFGTTLSDPIELTPIPPGERTLTLDLENYATWSDTHYLEPGGTWTVHAILEPDPGTISVTSSPAGANIYLAQGDQTSEPELGIDWMEKGVTPVVLTNIAPGHYTVKGVLDYYQDSLRTIDVYSNQTTEIGLNLTPARGVVRVIAQDELGTYLPGAYINFSPCFGEGCGQGPTDINGILEGSVNAGIYTINVWKQNYTAYTDEIEITTENTLAMPLEINATLAGNPGSINVTSNPSNALVYLTEGDQTADSEDGVNWVEKGVTPLTITGIQQGTYTLKLFLPGYIPDGLSSEIAVPVEGYPVKTLVTVSPGVPSYVNAIFRQATGKIRVTSNENSAEVFLDNSSIGFLISENGIYSRLFENIPTGTHTLQVIKNDFIPYQTSVEVSYQETTTIQANLYQVQQLTAFITMSPSYGRPPLEVRFTGAGAGPEGTTIVSYYWNFGDGASSQEQNPTHTYEGVGQYNVKLTVTDNNEQIAFKWVSVNVLSGDKIEVSPASGCLTIFADSATVGDGEITYSGNVILNGFLGVTGSVKVKDGPNGEITGTGNLITGNETVDTAIAAINNGESFIIAPKEHDVGGCYRKLTGTISNFSFSYYGLHFEASDPKLYNNRLSLTGSITSLGGILPAVGVGLSISPSGFDFGGRIGLPDFKISGFGIKDVFLELDLGCGNCWGTGITFELPPGVGIDVGGQLGIQNGMLNRVSAKAASLGLPIGNTGVFLGSINGGLEHIPPDPEPLVLKAGAGFYAGPKIPIPSFNLFNGRLQLAGGDLNLIGGDVDLIFDCSGKMTAQGVAYILDKDFGEIGSAGLTVDLNRGFYVWGELRYPPGDFAILKGNLAGKLDFDLEFQGSVSGTLQVPELLPIIGGMSFAQAAGYIDNDLIAAGVSLGDTVCVPVLGCYDLSLNVCLIFSFDDPGFSVATNWDAIQEVSLTGTPHGYAYSAPVQFAGIGIPMFLLAQSDRNPTIEQIFDLPGGLEVVIFHLQVFTEGVLPKFTVTSPHEMEYDQESDAVIWQGNDIAGDLWCAVPNPMPGRWLVTPHPSLEGTEYKITVYKLNEKPKLSITSPKDDIVVEAGTQVMINWEAEDPDSEAMIRLCYTESPLQQMENEQPAFPGNTIVKNISEESLKSTYTWDTKGVAPGKYYIYGVITDGKNFPVFAWSKGSVTIEDKKFPPPTKVKAYQDGSKIRVEWDSMPNAAGYHVYYQEVQDQTPLNLASSLAIWEDAEAEIRNLLSGRTYRIAVTTFQEDGLESGYSQPIEIAFR